MIKIKIPKEYCQFGNYIYQYSKNKNSQRIYIASTLLDHFVPPNNFNFKMNNLPCELSYSSCEKKILKGNKEIKLK